MVSVSRQYKYLTLRFTNEQYETIKRLCREVYPRAGVAETSRYLEEVVVEAIADRDEARKSVA